MTEPAIPHATTGSSTTRSGFRPRLLAVIAAAIVVVSLTAAETAQAHRNDESYLYLDVGDASLSGRVELPYGDLREVLGLRLAGTADDVLAELEADLGRIQAYAAENTAIGDSSGAWPLSFDGVELLFDDDVGPNGLGYVLLPYTVDLPLEAVPQLIDVTFTPFLAEIPDRNNIALVSNDWQRGVIDQETNELLVLNDGSPTGTIDLGDASQWRNFRASIDLGVDHIRTGPDHIFFVVVLLLPAVLVLVLGRWRPAPRFGPSALRILIVATMFTVAHSITFTLAGLDILPLPPSKFVETVIALSIAAAALYNLKPIFGHREWIIAFVFGLFHGMGFAGLVEDLDIDRSTQLVSLLGRNVGIEIGQLVIIVLTFPMLVLLRRTRVYMPLFYTASIALATLSGLWIIERVGEVDLSINGAINRLLEWPRSLFVMLALTAVAAVYREIEDRRGKLLPVASTDHADADADSDSDSGGDEDREREAVSV
jgi:hypothetical protein